MSIRPFTWNDLAAYARIVRESSAPSYAEADAEEYLRQPNLSPERDCFLAEVKDRVAGYALVVPEPKIGRVIIEGVVAPRFRRRGIGGRLLEHALVHAQALGARLAHVAVTPDSPDAQRLLQKHGFSEVRWQWRMRLSPARPASGAREALYSVRQLGPGEAALMTDLQNRAFAGNWGFSPNTPEENDYRLRMKGSRYEDVLLLETEGVPAAYCWTKMQERDNEKVGVIWMIGSAPEHRGRGLGRAMLNESIQYLAERGATAVELTVYADNTPAVRLYEATGFKKTGEIVFYEKRLQRQP